MAANTGRTTRNWVTFTIGDTSDVLRMIPVDSINGVGLTYDIQESVAFMDAIKGVLIAHPDLNMEISGPFDTTAAAAAPALSGSHTVLSALVGGNTPRMFDVKFGVRHAWDAEPQFGVTKSATSGCLVTQYTVDPDAQTYSATIRMYPGSTAPAWGVAAEA